MNQLINRVRKKSKNNKKTDNNKNKKKPIDNKRKISKSGYWKK